MQDLVNCYKLIVHLLKAVFSTVVMPINEDGSVIDTWAILAPSFKANMGGGKGADRRPLPGEVTLDTIGAKNDGSATIAIAVTS